MKHDEEKQGSGGHANAINIQFSFVHRNCPGPEKYSLAWMLIGVELRPCQGVSSEQEATELWLVGCLFCDDSSVDLNDQGSNTRSRAVATWMCGGD